MIKRFLLCIVLLSSFYRAHSTPEAITATPELEVYTPAQTTSVDELFGDSIDTRLPVPTFSKPSPFMIWLRSMGISLLCSYLACKEWIIRNYKRFFYIAPRLP